MSNRTTVHLMRHGEVYNPESILYGRLPGFVLSDLGHEMAAKVAKALAGRDIIEVRASPLERAQQTAAPIAESHGLPIGTDDRIIEAANRFEGKRVAVGDGVLSQPKYWKYLWDPFKPSWGEPYTQIADRMAAAIADAKLSASGHEVVLVSHQLPVWTSRLAAENRRLWHDPRRRQCNLASLTSLTFDDDRLQTITYSEPAAELVARAHKGAGA